MGIGTILEAKNILDDCKPNVLFVAKCLEGPVTSQITATAIQLHSGGITVALDRAAASKLEHLGTLSRG